jgi:hypothetical protein
MKGSVNSNKTQIPKRSAQQKSANANDTATRAVGFLMLYMTAIVLNAEQSKGEDRSSARFASVFLTLFIAIFILQKGKMGLGTIYLLLAQIAPPLRQPAMVGTLFMLYFFLMQ